MAVHLRRRFKGLFSLLSCSSGVSKRLRSAGALSGPQYSFACCMSSLCTCRANAACWSVHTTSSQRVVLLFTLMNKILPVCWLRRIP